MAPQQLTDYRIALGLLSFVLAAGLLLVAGLIGVSYGDLRALKRTGRNGVLELIAVGALRRHAIFATICLGGLWIFGHRVILGTPVGPLGIIAAMLVLVGAVIVYAVTETIDRWKIRFHARSVK